MQWVKKRLLYIVGAVVLISVSATFFSLVASTVTYAEPDVKTAEQDITCSIEKMGWLLCPTLEKAGDLSDAAYDLIANHLLKVEAELLGGGSSGTKKAWDISVGFANIMFIIAFLIIIVSQVTGFGLTNYGIKRMLPRLVVAAIAVNTSYYICQLMVDLSNIGGFQIKSLLTEIGNGISGSIPIVQSNTQQAGMGTIFGITTIILGSAVLVAYWLPALFSIVLVVLMATLSTIIILLLRKALIVLLVVLSPIAFVMYLLPNTEKLFSRWLKMFGQLLMVFPVVALLFGGGNLAAAIILAAGSQDNNGFYQTGTNVCIKYTDIRANTGNAKGLPPSAISKAECGQNSIPVLLGLVAAGISIIPLVAIYPVLQGALAAAGTLGGKVQTLGQSMMVNPARGRLKGDREYIKSLRQEQALSGHGIKGTKTFQRWGAERAMLRDSQKSRLNKARIRYAAEASLDRDPRTGQLRRDARGNAQLTRFGQRMAGSSVTDLNRANVQAETSTAGNAVFAMQQLQAEELKAASAISDSNPDLQQTERSVGVVDSSPNNANNPARVVSVDFTNIDLNDPTFAAKLQTVLAAADTDKRAAIVDAITHTHTESLASRTVADFMAQNSNGMLSGGQIANIRNGDSRDANGIHVAMDRMVVQNMAAGRYSDEEVARFTGGEMDFIEHAITQRIDPGDALPVGVRGEQELTATRAAQELAGAKDNIAHDRDLVAKVKFGVGRLGRNPVPGRMNRQATVNGVGVVRPGRGTRRFHDFQY